MTVSHCAPMGYHRVRQAASIPALCLCLLLSLATAGPAAAVGLLRDPDIEHGLSVLAAPILQAAGLNPDRVKILIVDNKTLNAFVIDGQAIYLHAGMIEKLGTAPALQAVIAHEAAHIANGHIARRMSNFRNSRTVAGLGMALAALALAAGADSGAAAGLAIGTSSSATRAFLAHTRAEEASADASAARYLNSAGISPQALVDVHEVFRGQELLTVGRQDPYMRSHPLTRDRIRAAQAFVAAHGTTTRPDAAHDYWYARLRGKLSAFTRVPKWTLQRIGDERYADVRLMREAIAHHRMADTTRALAALDAALALRPDDAYFYELKGQILLESRRFSDAVGAYAAAAERAPRNAMILGGYGRALLATGQPKAALAPLEAARSRDFRDARLLRDLGQAYAQSGQPGMASLATAERYALLGRMDDAALHARRAVGQLPTGSVGWQRAQDVLSAADT